MNIELTKAAVAGGGGTVEAPVSQVYRSKSGSKSEDRSLVKWKEALRARLMEDESFDETATVTAVMSKWLLSPLQRLVLAVATLGLHEVWLCIFGRFGAGRLSQIHRAVALTSHRRLLQFGSDQYFGTVLVGEGLAAFCVSWALTALVMGIWNVTVTEFWIIFSTATCIGAATTILLCILLWRWRKCSEEIVRDCRATDVASVQLRLSMRHRCYWCCCCRRRRCCFKTEEVLRIWTGTYCTQDEILQSARHLPYVGWQRRVMPSDGIVTDEGQQAASDVQRKSFSFATMLRLLVGIAATASIILELVALFATFDSCICPGQNADDSHAWSDKCGAGPTELEHAWIKCNPTGDKWLVHTLDVDRCDPFVKRIVLIPICLGIVYLMCLEYNVVVTVPIAVFIFGLRFAWVTGHRAYFPECLTHDSDFRALLGRDTGEDNIKAFVQLVETIAAVMIASPAIRMVKNALTETSKPILGADVIQDAFAGYSLANVTRDWTDSRDTYSFGNADTATHLAATRLVSSLFSNSNSAETAEQITSAILQSEIQELHQDLQTGSLVVDTSDNAMDIVQRYRVSLSLGPDEEVTSAYRYCRTLPLFARLIDKLTCGCWVAFWQRCGFFYKWSGLVIVTRQRVMQVLVYRVPRLIQQDFHFEGDLELNIYRLGDNDAIFCTVAAPRAPIFRCLALCSSKRVSEIVIAGPYGVMAIQVVIWAMDPDDTLRRLVNLLANEKLHGPSEEVQSRIGEFANIEKMVLPPKKMRKTLANSVETLFVCPEQELDLAENMYPSIAPRGQLQEEISPEVLVWSARWIEMARPCCGCCCRLRAPARHRLWLTTHRVAVSKVAHVSTLGCCVRRMEARMTFLAQPLVAGYSFEKERLPGGRIEQYKLKISMDLGKKKVFPMKLNLLSRSYVTRDEDPQKEDKYRQAVRFIGRMQNLVYLKK